MEIIIFSGLILIIITLLVLSFIPLPFGSPTVQMKGPYDIHNSTKLYTSYDFINNSSVTFQGFIYLQQLQKTVVTTACSSTDQSLPNCDTGRYSLCECVSGDCSKCMHTGYLQVLDINKICSLEILGAPDGGRQGKASVQFTVKTQSSGAIDNSGSAINPEMHPDSSGNASSLSNIYLETFVLPPIPFQQWTMITISREGRRFDFYYNDQLVLSKHTSTVLYNSQLSGSVLIGNDQINGSSGFFTMYKTIQSAEQIHNQYNSFIDTKKTPIFDVSIPSNMKPMAGIFGQITLPSALNIPSLCPSGDCLGNPINPPANPYYEWSSSYA